MTFEDRASLATMHPLFDAILRAHGAPRKGTVKAHPRAMQIVLARLEEAQEIARQGRVDLGDSS